MKSKNKNIFLLIAVIVILFLCYKFSISNTIAIRKEYKNLIKQESIFNDIPKQLSLYANKEIYYDSILNTMNIGDTSLENNILRLLNVEAKKGNFKIIDFNNPHVYQTQDNTFNTYNFTLQGNYTSLLKAIYTIEKKNSFGEIIHLNFQKKKNYSTRKNFLNATVFIQNIK